MPCSRSFTGSCPTTFLPMRLSSWRAQPLWGFSKSPLQRSCGNDFKPWRLPARATPWTLSSPFGQLQWALSSRTRLASLALLIAMADPIAEAAGPRQHCINTPGGAEMVQSAVQALLEDRPDLAAVSLDAENAFNMLDRGAVEAALRADPSLHPLIPIFEMLYKDRDPELWYYGSDNVDGCPKSILTSKRGVRQGDPLSMALFCITVAPVWDELLRVAGDGVLLAYADDGILFVPPSRVAHVNNKLDSILGQVGLSPVRSPKKTYVVWPLGTDVRAMWDLGDTEAGPHAPRLLSHPGVIKCLGCPHHMSHDTVFVTKWLQPVEDRHDRLLALTSAISELCPRSAMRLLQVTGVRRFQHVMRPLPPAVSHALLERRDLAIAACKRRILQDDEDILQGPLGTIANGPAQFGGCNTSSVADERHAAHVACYGLVLGPLASRLSSCPAPSPASKGTHARLASHLRSAGLATTPWAVALRQARDDLCDQVDLTGEDAWMPEHINGIAPPRTSMETAGDRLPASPQSRDMQDTQPPDIPAIALSEKGMKRLMGKFSFAVRAKLHCQAYRQLTPRQRTWSNSTAGRGSVSYLYMDTSPVHRAPPLVSRTAMRISQGLPGVSPRLHPNLTQCPTCA